MALLTKDLQKLPPLYSQEHTPDPLALVRFYDTLGNWSWYGIEFDGKNLFFGLVFGLERELGYFSLEEFEAVNSESGFPRIKQDLTFTAKPISEIR